MKKTLEIFKISNEENFIIPILPAKVKAGGYGSFESPALDFPDDSIDLLKLLIKDKETVFFGRVTGSSLSGIGIFDNDLLIIQKDLFPSYDDVVIAYIEGEFFVKKFRPKYKDNSFEIQNIKLKSENPDYSDIFIDENSEFQLWGVVTWNLHNLRK